MFSNGKMMRLLFFCMLVLFQAAVSEATQRVKVISYNMAAGADREPEYNENLLSKKQSFYRFSREFEKLYKADPDADWILCVQEILRDDQDTWYHHDGTRSRNQVDMLQTKLNDFTGVYWYKNSHQQEDNRNKGAVAIYSTAKITKVQRWLLAGDRPAVAVKVNIDPEFLWVVNVHLLSGQDGTTKDIREDSVEEIRQNIDTFDKRVPVVLAGDFNVQDPAITDGNRADKVDPDHFDKTVNCFINDGYTRGLNFEASREVGTFKSWWVGKIILDYLLVDEKDGVCVMQESTTLDFRSSDGGYASDHSGIITELLCSNGGG